MERTAKKLIRNLMYRLAAKDESALLERVKDASVVSLDVFDTAVKRDVALPEDVFILMDHTLRREGILIENFPQLRMEAERAAREEHPHKEVTLEEIYRRIPLEEPSRAALMQLECETEAAVSTYNIPIKRVYDACVEQGKKILFISDMYLPQETIREILRKNGYTTGNLYVSSTAGVTKRDGSLFSWVREAEKAADTDNWVHIGDGILPDYFSPRRLGIKAFLIEREPSYHPYIDREFFRRNADYRKLNHFINTRLCRDSDFYERVGYAVLGPMLYGFAQWLEREIPKDETIVFLAREGRLLQQAFEIVSQRPSVYLHISRRAANVAYLSSVPDIETKMGDGIRANKLFSTQEQWAKNWGLSNAEIQDIFSTNSLRTEDVVDGPAMERRLMAAIWPAVRKKSAGQFALLQRYLRQLGLTAKCAVVDIGWRGTMQALLVNSAYQIGGSVIQWDGYYLGTWDDKIRPASAQVSRKGFLFESGFGQKILDSVKDTAAFCETMFLPVEGTTEGYRESPSGEIIPILAAPENEGEICGLIRSMQGAGLRFVEDMFRSPAAGILNVNAEASAGNYIALARVPSLETLRRFGKFNFYDGCTSTLVSEHGFLYYMVHPRQFIRDFSNVAGKVWWLKSIFKIPLPYVQLINLARKLFVKEL